MVRNGFSLAEVLIALLVVTTTLMTLLMVFSLSVRVMTNNNMKVQENTIIRNRYSGHWSSSIGDTSSDNLEIRSVDIEEDIASILKDVPFAHYFVDGLNFYRIESKKLGAARFPAVSPLDKW